MQRIQKISATQARNDFFNLLNRSYLEKQSFLVQKGKVPMAYITPVDPHSDVQENMLIALKELRKIRQTLPLTSDSIQVIAQMRNA